MIARGSDDDGNRGDTTVYVLMIARTTVRFPPRNRCVALGAARLCADVVHMCNTHEGRIRFLWLSHNARYLPPDYHAYGAAEAERVGLETER
jgi:hypothetical protein